MIENLRKYLRYRRDRKIAPAKGQVWIQDNTRLTIRDVYENGNVAIRTQGFGWSGEWCDSKEEWLNRHRCRRLYLESSNGQ